jgi:hypothetical protein
MINEFHFTECEWRGQEYETPWFENHEKIQ